MSTKDRSLVECTTCYTLTSFLNGVCPECGGTGVVEEEEPQPSHTPSEKKGDPESALD